MSSHPDHIADANKKAQPAPAPLPVEVYELRDGCAVLVDADEPRDAVIADLKAHISDLTRRVAEAEDCLTIAHMDGYHKGQKAGQSEHNNSVRMGQYILEAKTEKRLREAAEARVRELEAESMTFRTECINLETQRADLEAFKTRVMTWAWGRCGTCEHRDRPRTCDACWTCTDHEDKPNWTPPQAWVVGK